MVSDAILCPLQKCIPFASYGDVWHARIFSPSYFLSYFPFMVSDASLCLLNYLNTLRYIVMILYMSDFVLSSPLAVKQDIADTIFLGKMCLHVSGFVWAITPTIL